eukprot:2497268-Lingulodinium_polyedra.AAC.1
MCLSCRSRRNGPAFPTPPGRAPGLSWTGRAAGSSCPAAMAWASHQPQARGRALLPKPRPATRDDMPDLIPLYHGPPSMFEVRATQCGLA